MTAENRIYTHRIHGNGPALFWDDGNGFGRTPAQLYEDAVARHGPEKAAIAAAYYFGVINGWRFVRRDISEHGDVSDWFETPRGPAVVVHTNAQYAEAARAEVSPKVTLDRLPAPWVQPEPWQRPYTGYVLRRLNE